MKSTIKFLIVTIVLVGAGFPASAGSFIQTPEVVQEQPVIVINEENTEILEFAPPASVENEIPESKIARRMTQAEKNENAKVNDSWGGAITIIAMCIVISALAILSLLFLCFGKISEKLLTKTKKKAKAAAAHVEDEAHHELSSGEVIAAISMALAEHFDEGHDVEDTILTIRRMKKAYSPWNSKIYNLRSMPEHVRNHTDLSALSKR